MEALIHSTIDVTQRRTKCILDQKLKKEEKKAGKSEPSSPSMNSMFIIVSIMWAIFFFGGLLLDKDQLKMPYSSFVEAVEKNEITQVNINKNEISGSIKNHKEKHFRTVRVDDPDLLKRLESNHVKYEGTIDDTFFQNLFLWGILVYFGFSILGAIARAIIGKEGFGAGLLSIEKNKSKMFMEDKIKTTFADVAGVDEAKEELQEVIGFLKDPQKYGRLGGHLPKGILLVGPPGTGKTLLARAVAGEAGVPFFCISGSEFVELYVGVGAARVRDLFEQAQQKAPCILFVDELDALGRARSINGGFGGHDEKEQTLNQLLVEMDGFDPRQGVVVLAATNRPEILDVALLRAGRFDRQILVDRPDRLARCRIIEVHLKNKVVSPAVSAQEIAASTPGFTGADLANLVNEAVLLATRKQAQCVEPEDFTQALERIVAGLEKKNRLLNESERKIVAHHEMGHALVGMLLSGCDQVQKVSIIPRGIGALGYTMQRPVEDRYLASYDDLCHKLAALLGGRAAEIIMFGSASTGSADDLGKATDIARSMATRFGMTKVLGPVTYESDPHLFLGDQASYIQSKRYSEETAREIDIAVKDIVEQALQSAINLLKHNKDILEKGALLLMQKETLERSELEVLVKAKPTIYRETNSLALG